MRKKLNGVNYEVGRRLRLSISQDSSVRLVSVIIIPLDEIFY